MTTHTVSLVTPPTVLKVAPGDSITVVGEFDYIGPEVDDARVRVFLFSWTFADAHNEKAFDEGSFVIPQTSAPAKRVYLEPMTFTLPTSGLPAGLLYGLGIKIFNVVGKEWFFYLGKNDPPYYKWVVEVTGVISEISNLRISSYAKA